MSEFCNLAAGITNTDRIPKSWGRRLWRAQKAALGKNLEALLLGKRPLNHKIPGL